MTLSGTGKRWLLPFCYFLLFASKRHIPAAVVSVEQFMGQVGTWFSKIIFVQLLYLLIFVGEADCIFLIHGIELGASLLSQLLSIVNGVRRLRRSRRDRP